MFIDNKYSIWYNDLINSAKLRLLPDDTYTEQHHIIPRSMGGTNEVNNLVRLTAREHFICHLLLTKMVSGDVQRKMIFAFVAMSWTSTNQQRYKINSRLFNSIKVKRTHSTESKAKMSAKAVGRKSDPAAVEARAAKMRGKPSPIKGKNTQTASSKEKIGNAQRELLSKMSPEEKSIRAKHSCSSPESWTIERKEKISKALTGITRTDEQRKNYGNHLRGKSWPEARRLAYLAKKENKN